MRECGLCSAGQGRPRSVHVEEWVGIGTIGRKLFSEGFTGPIWVFYVWHSTMSPWWIALFRQRLIRAFQRLRPQDLSVLGITKTGLGNIIYIGHSPHDHQGKTSRQ